MGTSKITTLLFLLTLTLTSFAQTKPTADIEAYLKGRMEKRRIPGLQVAVVRGGKIVRLGAYGTANLRRIIDKNGGVLEGQGISTNSGKLVNRYWIEMDA